MRRYHSSSFPLAAVGLLGLLAYGNSLSNSFHFDDFVGIVRNPAIRDLRNIPSYFTDTTTFSLAHTEWRPVVQITYALNYSLAGLNPVFFRLFNLLFHIGTAFLIYLMVVEMERQRESPGGSGSSGNWIAMGAAALFVVHTANSEVVNYIWARSSLLAAFFYLLSFYCFLRGPFSGKEKTLFWHIAGLLAYGLGLGTKPTAATLPLALLLYEILWINPRGRSPFGLFRHEPWRLKKYMPLFTLSLVGILALVFFLPWILTRVVASTDVSSLTYLFTQFRAWIYYLRLFVWPDPLVVDFPGFGWSTSLWDTRVLPSLAVAMTILIGSWRLRKEEPAITFFTFWFFIALLPESSFIPLPNPVAGYRPYLANVGASVVTALLSLKAARGVWSKSKMGGEVEGSPSRFWLGYGLILGMILIALTAATIKRNGDWRDELTLWSDALRKDPSNPRAHINLGLQFAQRGDYKKAQEMFDKAVERSPDYSDAYMFRGYFSLLIGKDGEALADVERSINLGPRSLYNFFFRGEVYRKIGEYDKALADYEAVVRSNPRFTDARYGIAMVHWKRREFRETGEVCRMLVETDPDDPRGYDCQGASLTEQQRFLEALNLYQKAVARLPKNGKLWYSLGLAYKAVGMHQEAQVALQTASRLMGDPAKRSP